MRAGPLAVAIFLVSLALVLFELVLTRIFAIVLFAQFAHLAISLALLGIGVGALALHLFPRLVPEDRLGERLGWLALAMAAGMVLAVALAVRLPFTRATDALGDSAAVSFGTRRARTGELIRPAFLVAIAPAIALPFACGGIAFAAAFRYVRQRIGGAYAADLWGGAAGCLLFLPVLSILRGPDTVAVAALAAALAAFAAFVGVGLRRGAAVAGVTAGVAAVAVVVGLFMPILKIRQAAGFDERRIFHEEWTPLTRLGLLEDRGRTFVVLDNTSRSEILTSRARLLEYERGVQTIVFKLHREPGRVAILAAAAGADVMAAVHLGHRDVTAVDIASSIFGLVRERYAKVPVNPYRIRGVRTIGADARSAVLHDRGRFDVVEMAQANFFSYGGVLSQAWNPELLTTTEAFADYLDHLTPDGTIAFTWNAETYRWAKTAAAALRARGVARPWTHMAFVGSRSPGRLVLVKKRPFSPDEAARLREIVRADGHRLELDPERATARWRAMLGTPGPILTDDHPYVDDPATFKNALASFARGANAPGRSAALLLHRVLLLQLGILLVAGVLLLGLPFVWRGRREVKGLAGTGPVLGYFASIGYGYLAVEIVLIHQLVLLVGHPTYAVTLVLFVLLVSSGTGSLFAGRLPDGAVARRLPIMLVLVVGIAAAHAFLLTPLMTRALLGLGLGPRALLVGLSLFPLGFVMGMPFPLALRRMPPVGGESVPWCWAINGWMSVLASLGTVFLSRLSGYSTALALGLLAYVLAIPLSFGLARIRVREAAAS